MVCVRLQVFFGLVAFCYCKKWQENRSNEFVLNFASNLKRVVGDYQNDWVYTRVLRALIETFGEL